MSVSEATEPSNVLEGELDSSEKSVAPLELFFDLVFVFALTQVTALMSGNPTWEGLGQGLLILAALWWAWGAYAWLTNYIAADEGVERLLMFVVMAAFLVAALAVPHAFGADALLFGVAYAVARWMHIFIFAEANDDVDTAMAIRRLARTALPGPALLIVAAFLDPPLQALVWILALAIDLSGPFVFGVEGFRVSAGHFAERFGLIVIIALGESIVAIGAGVEGALDSGVLVAAVLGIVVAAALWWAYFDVIAVVAERRFRRTTGSLRVRIARDSYSYLHLPMIAGIILIALGIKKTMGDVDEPLKEMPAAALFGGVALYYAGHVGFRLRNVGSLNRQRLLAAIACLALIPLATEIDALISLAIAAAITSGVVAYEAIRFAEARRRLREGEAASAH
jgi:low temperature requirement protein LtrA